MRGYAHSTVISESPKERPRYAIPEPTCSIRWTSRGACPMAATSSDIKELRGLLYYLENPPRFDDPVVRRAHVDGLKKLINELETEHPPSPLWWLAGAIKRSYKKVGPMYIVTDRDLNTWALEKLFEMFPDEDEG